VVVLVVVVVIVLVVVVILVVVVVVVVVRVRVINPETIAWKVGGHEGSLPATKGTFRTRPRAGVLQTGVR
jgi:hypothetical protein